MNTYDRSNNLSNSYKKSADGQDLAKTFGAFRKAIRHSREELQKQKKTLAPEAQKIRDIYAQNVAESKIKELYNSYNDNLTNKRNALQKDLQSLVDAKRDQMVKFFTDAPDEATLRTLQTISLRGDALDESEVNMLITRCADSYQALRTLQTMAQKSGYDFIMPCDPESAVKDMEVVASVCEDMLKALDMDAQELGYKEMEFLSDVKDGLVVSRLENLDNERCFFIAETPKAEPSRLEKLDKAIEEAGINGEYSRYIKLRQLKEDRLGDIMTPQEKAQALDAEINALVESARVGGEDE